ncbi:uncharacterized protein [Watersipora subatra]|uniref:uncharacterized protein isoform X2 n=1 Tax=Watersipora subatra TaxID=2589382 RepID=UPI00355C1DCB
MAKQPIPVGYQDFFQRKNLETAFKVLQKDGLIILTGPSGSGKTELANQLKKKYSHMEDLVEARFRCDSLESVKAELWDYSTRKGFPLDSFHSESLDEIFTNFYKYTNERFHDRIKFFVFDDAELSTQIIYQIDSKIFRPLCQLPEDSLLRKSWQIVVTTQHSTSDWLTTCDYVKADHFLQINGFSEVELADFLHQCERARALTDDEFDVIKEKFGRLPIMVKYLRMEIESDVSVSASDILWSFVRSINQINPENKAYAALHVSLKRLVLQSLNSDCYKQLLITLTMFSDRNISTDLLTACIEVILPGDNQAQELPKAAHRLQISFTGDMVRQHLCERPVEYAGYAGTSLISLHKMVKQGMRLFREPTDAQRDAAVAKMALIALNRMMPKDGRFHWPPAMHEYLYNHAQCLVQEVQRLEAWGAVSRIRTPCVLLLMCQLHVAMAYAQFSLRGAGKSATRHVETALNYYSKLHTDRNYSDLGAWLPDIPVDVQKGMTLYDESIGAQSILYKEQDYHQLVTESLQFQRLSKADKTLLAESENTYDISFVNNHLTASRLRELPLSKKVLAVVKIREFYVVELLGDIYGMAARTSACRSDESQPNSLAYAAAARSIYQRIRQEFDVSLLAEVLLERDMLNFQLESDSLNLEQLDIMADSWRALSGLEGQRFEYGILRADLTNDAYHKFLCEEGLIRTLGRRCALEHNDDEFDTVSSMFDQLISKTKEGDPKLKTCNQMTTCKAYRNYADFLWNCEKLREAVRALLDAFIFLNSFLLTKSHRSDFPEQEETCSKVKPLLDLLWLYYRGYDASHSAGGLLQHDGADQQRIDYVARFVKCWQKNDHPGPEKLKIMELILSSSDIDLAEPFEHQTLPVQATGL